MSDSFLYLYGGDDGGAEEGPLPTLATREEVLRALSVIGQVDLVIVGGGLSGVTLARAAALQGCDVLLLEPGYFGERSSPWRDLIANSLASKPVAVATTLRALSDVMTDVAPHLAMTREWRDETQRGALGRFATWLSLRGWRAAGAETSLSIIPDLDERLLIRETVLAARQEGAFALSAAAAAYVERDVDEGGFRVGVKDLLTGDTIEIHTGVLYIDPTFPQPVASRIGTPIVRRNLPRSTAFSVVYAVDSNDETRGDLSRYRSLDLGDGVKASVTSLGSGLIEVCVLAGIEAHESDSLLRRAREVCEAGGYVVREEVSQRAHGKVFAKRAKASLKNGILLSEERVPWDIFAVLPSLLSKVPACGTVRRSRRPLPGEWRDDERERFIAAAKAAGVRDDTIGRVIERWRGRARYIPLVEDGFQEVCPGVLRGEVSLAVLSDQVSSSEDLLFGSLQLHATPGWREHVGTLHRILDERKLDTIERR